MKRFASFLLAACALAALAPAALASNVKVARFWHNHQPIYWPDWSSSEPNRVQYAKDSIDAKSGGATHPDNNLSDIFGLHDRVQSYQYGPRDSLACCNSSAGYAISYSGSLIENVRSLGNAGYLGYSSDWYSGYRDARSWTDGNGNPRLDMVGFCFHHALAPVLPKSVFRKELKTFKQAWWKAWGGSSDLSDHSKGFFPTEMAFTEEMIDVLVDEGYEWAIVASHHLSRTCPTYFNNGTADGNYSINSSEPNKADLLGPSPTEGWWYDSPNPGNCAWNVSPFAYQLHKAQYVNPSSGEIKQMVVVPSDDVLSYKAGYSGATMSYAENISAYANDSSQPVIILPATDGDNAWGGGDSSWKESWPGFTSDAANAGWDNTTIQSFVDSYGSSATLAHVEDGAWIFPEMCYGSPYFLKWVDPPCNPNDLDSCYPGTQIDLETPGFALKFWDWAPIIAAANWCETAEAQSDRCDAWRIADPYENGTYYDLNAAEKAWHIYLCGLDSGFNYYGGKGNDDECKPPLANLNAINVLKGAGFTQDVLAANDTTPPTIFRPQRFPYNPGGYTFGWFNYTSEDGNYRKKMGSDFYVWTHAYDVSGIPDGGVVLHVRADKDGTNPLDSVQNETYAGGDEVDDWTDIVMTKRTLPSTTEELNAAANAGDINYEYEPAALADYYFAKVSMFRGQLVDYYITAVDNNGNSYSSDIQHVWVEDDGTAPDGGGASASASFSPASPTDCGDITVTFKAGGGVLSNASQVVMGYNFTGTDEDWATVDMTETSVEDTWTYTFACQTSPFTNNAPSLAVFFSDGGTNYESRNGVNWTVSISDCEAPVNGVQISPNPAVAGEDVTVYYYPDQASGQVLASASSVYVHHGYNDGNWTDAPGDAMTYVSADGAWEYTYAVPSNAETLVMCFNDGNTTWDNNSSANWTFSVTGTVYATPWFDGVCALTNLASQPYSPLELGYNPSGRALAASASVSVHMGTVDEDGATNWTTHAMSSQGTFWTYDWTPAIGSTAIIACFTDGSSWDSNDGANWSFDLSTNYAAVADGLVVTFPSETATADAATATVQGTAGSDIAGTITWTNANAGTGGSFAASTVWSQEVTLANGTNEIVFTAQSAAGSDGYASDSAANYTADEDYTGVNGGTGFEAWITSIPAGSSANTNEEVALSYVVLSPGPAQGCDSVLKFYPNNACSALAYGTVDTVYAHWASVDSDGTETWNDLPGTAMTYNESDEAWELAISVPSDAASLQFLFNDGGDTWLHYSDIGGDTQNWICSVTAGSSGNQGGVWAEPEGDGFGMWENFGYATKIYRPFGRDLAAGDEFSFTFKNGNIAWYTDSVQPGVGAGVCAIDGDGTVEDDCGFRFYFNGGQEVYETPYGNTTIGWTTEPITVTVSMADSTNFTATFAVDGTVESTVAGAFDKPCNAFRAWSWSNKEDVEGNDYDVFVDDLSLGELTYTNVTATAVLVYSSGESDVYVTTTSPVVAAFDASTGKLSITADVDAADGTTIDVYTTDSLGGTWTKTATATVADGAVVLDGLDLGEGSLFVSVGKPAGL